MRSPEATSHDVLIAGAGPVGILLACELRLAGCSVLVLEQASNPHSPLKELPFGLRGLSVPTIESLDRRGLLEAVEERAVSRDAPATAHWMRQQRRPAGHFAGIQFFEDQLAPDQWPYRLPEPVGSIATTMASLEAVLTDRASALGVEIRRGCGVEAVAASDENVIRDLIGTRDGATYFAARVMGVSLRYDLGESHPLVGRSAPDLLLADRSRLNEHLRDGRGLLLDLGASTTLPAQADRWRGKFDFLRSGVEESLGLATLLVRPDGIVAWATGTGIDDGGLALAASRWFGAAAPADARASSSHGLDQ